MDPHDKNKEETQRTRALVLQPLGRRTRRGIPPGRAEAAAGSPDPRPRSTQASRAGSPSPGMRIPGASVAKAPRKTEERNTAKANQRPQRLIS